MRVYDTGYCCSSNVIGQKSVCHVQSSAHKFSKVIMLTPDKLKTGKSLRKTMQQSLSIVASNTLFCCTCAATKRSSTQENATLSSGMSTSRRWIKLPLDTKLDSFSLSRGDKACGVYVK